MENPNQPVASVNQVAQTGYYNKPKLTPALKIFKVAVSLWWKNFEKILRLYWEGIKITLLPLAITAVFSALGFFIITPGFIANILKVIAGISGFVTFILMIYYWTRAYIAIFLLIKNDYRNEPKETYQNTKDLFWPYIGLSLLTALLVLCWSLLLIIPGIIFSVFYSLAIYVLFFEGKQGMAALRRSRALVKGYFWPVLGRFCVLMVIVWLFMILLIAPIANAPETSAWVQIWNGVVQIISWLLGPIVMLFSYNIYTDLVKIKDVEPQIKQ